MSLARPPRGGQVHESAVERLDDAQGEQSRLREAADDARGTPSEETAAAELREAEHRVTGQEAWLTWIDRGF